LIIVLVLTTIKTQAQALALSIADSLYAIGDYTNAINKYAEVGTLRSDLQIARAYNTIGNFDKAITQYNFIIARDTTLQIATFELGKLNLKVRKPKEALALFSKLAIKEGSNPEYLYYQGEAYRNLEKHEKSVISYKKAIAIDSTHLRSLFQLAKYYVVQKEDNVAMPYIDQALGFYKNDLSFINLKALAHFHNGAFDKAIPWFKRVLELGDKKKYVYEKLAHSYFKEWNFEKAKETYHILIRNDDSDYNAYFNLGHVFWKNKQKDSAQFYIKKSIEVQTPNFEREYSSLAGFSREENDLKNALKYYKLAYEENTKNSINFYQVCTLTDQYAKEPKIKLQCYEDFIKKFGSEKGYFTTMVNKRISELKEEIHFTKD